MSVEGSRVMKTQKRGQRRKGGEKGFLRKRVMDELKFKEQKGLIEEESESRAHSGWRHSTRRQRQFQDYTFDTSSSRRSLWGKAEVNTRGPYSMGL